MHFSKYDIDILDDHGNPLGKSILSDLCHIEGLWHRAFAILPFTEWGDVILRKQVGDHVFELGRWSIPEAHIPTETMEQDCALNAISLYFGFTPDLTRLHRLTPDGSIVEESQLPVLGSTNRERKTLYAYVLSWSEYRALQDFHLAKREINGAHLRDEVSSEARLISAKSLIEEIETKPYLYANCILAVLHNQLAGENIMQFWTALVNEKRRKICSQVADVLGRKCDDQLDDAVILDVINPQPQAQAAEFEVAKILYEAKNTCPGAYRIGEMLEIAVGIKSWAKKLSDPYKRYVEEDLDSLRRSVISHGLLEKIGQVDSEDASRFVRDVLHFPLENGTILRNQMGNLEEITASRNILKLYLRYNTRLPSELIENPQEPFNEFCNRIVRDMWQTRIPQAEKLDNAEMHHLLTLNVLLNALDFHTPDFRNCWAGEETLRALIESQFEKADKAHFAESLGGDSFFEEFLNEWLNPEKDSPVCLVYFVDNNGQLVVSLKCVEAFLLRQPQLRVVLVPKNGQHGNDASWADVYRLLEIDAGNPNPIFDKLRRFRDTKRLLICEQGPQTQGLNPRHLSRSLCRHLNEAHLIFAEGQAFAEIRGWFKPTYMLFQVKGRVAEAIHGVSKEDKALAFIRVGGGVYHFSGLSKLPQRVLFSPSASKAPIHVWGQTTTEYVRAIGSSNFKILRDRLFGGKQELLFRQLRQEAMRTDKSIAEILIGNSVPTREQSQASNAESPVQVFAVGGGGGFNQVTLKALQMLGLRVAAGVPSTDDGGSTGKLQKMVSKEYGYMFGVGDAAAILEQLVPNNAKKPILSFRSPNEERFLTDVLVEVILKEGSHPTVQGTCITDCTDFLSFVCEQLNFARIIDENFLGPNGVPGFSIKGASIRNLNILAAFHACKALDKQSALANQDSSAEEGNAERAWLYLHRSYGLDCNATTRIRVVPVTYDRACLWATYSKPIPKLEIERLKIPCEAISLDGATVYGQQYIDQVIPVGKIVDFGLVNRANSENCHQPKANEAYIHLLRSSELFIMGAGSLFGSQLAQLAVPGVVDELIEKSDARKVLILNHVCMNETMFYSLTDHIKAIESLANRVANDSTKKSAGGRIKIGHIFTDIVVPRTVAREIDLAIALEHSIEPESLPAGLDHIRLRYYENPHYVTPDGNPAKEENGIFLNHYIDYVIQHPDFRRNHQITDWEMRILGSLDQSPDLYRMRSEAGRYRGAVYALDCDISYLIENGIPPRHIYEVESIAMNQKILKAEGKPTLEEFPGLIPESLVGIFKILLAKGTP
jgi:2-phospho-L-lactate transferase/gluconeogenesis factor (CofD/UPF0052 family)